MPRAGDAVVRRREGTVAEVLLRIMVIHYYYFTLSPKQLEYCLAHSRYSIIFVERKFV